MTYRTFNYFILDFSFPSSYPVWYLAAWNAMAVDKHVEKPDEEKNTNESDGESASEETEENSK